MKKKLWLWTWRHCVNSVIHCFPRDARIWSEVENLPSIWMTCKFLVLISVNTKEEIPMMVHWEFALKIYQRIGQNILLEWNMKIFLRINWYLKLLFINYSIWIEGEKIDLDKLPSSKAQWTIKLLRGVKFNIWYIHVHCTRSQTYYTRSSTWYKRAHIRGYSPFYTWINEMKLWIIVHNIIHFNSLYFPTDSK